MGAISTEDIRDSQGRITGTRVIVYDALSRASYADVPAMQAGISAATVVAAVAVDLSAQVAAGTAAPAPAAAITPAQVRTIAKGKGAKG